MRPTFTPKVTQANKVVDITSNTTEVGNKFSDRSTDSKWGAQLYANEGQDCQRGSQQEQDLTPETNSKNLEEV